MSNLDQIFGLKESDPLVAMNPLLLLGCVLAAIAIGCSAPNSMRTPAISKNPSGSTYPSRR